MASSLHYWTETGALVMLDFDAVPQATHQHAAQATEFPVETGAVIADHVVQKPDIVRLEGIVTATPFGEWYDPVSRYGSASRASAEGRPNSAYWALLDAKEAGTVVTVTTGRRAYDQMVIEGMEVNDTPEQAEALFVSLTLKRIRRTSTSRVTVPSTPKAAGKVSKGAQVAEPVPEVPNSLLRTAKDLATGWLDQGGTP